MEATGHDINLKVEGKTLSKKISKMSHSEMLRQITELQENPEDWTQDTKQTFEKADMLIESPFSFYSTDLRLNEDQQIDIANRALIRFYKLQVQKISLEKEGCMAELFGLRQNLEVFKKNSEMAER